jgi:hypothetical protein
MRVQKGSHFEPLVLQDSFDGGISVVWVLRGFDDSDLEDDAKGAVSDDLDALVLDVDFGLGLAVKHML